MTSDCATEQKRRPLELILDETLEKVSEIHSMMMLMHRKVDWIYEVIGTPSVHDVQHSDMPSTDSIDDQSH